VLTEQDSRVRQERSSRKEPLSDSDARALIRRVNRVRVARGRKIVEIQAADASLYDLKGPTGNYRAPMVVAGKILLVGFNPEALAELL